jgi:hypothetical protein
MPREQWAALTNEEKRVKIAELCELERVRHIDRTATGDFHRIEHYKELVYGPGLPVPDYLNDLNAMHEAEKVLSPEQQSRYYDHLTHWHHRHVWKATAAQRAEAFVLTMEEAA